MVLAIQRQDANAVYQAGLNVIGAHTRLVVDAAGDWIPKPDGATHIMIQTETQSTRIVLDETLATISKGFVIANASVTAEPIIWTISVSGTGVSVFSPAGGSVLQYQWLG